MKKSLYLFLKIESEGELLIKLLSKFHAFDVSGKKLYLYFCHETISILLSRNYIYTFVTKLYLYFCHETISILLSRNYIYTFVTKLYLYFCHERNYIYTFVTKLYLYLNITAIVAHGV